MKRKLLTFALAVLTIGLLGSCSKINERIDGLEGRINGIENEQIASIENQIVSINTSIADLVTIRSNIQDLISKTQAQGGDITGLKAADVSLGQRIDELKSYIDGELTGYAKIDWVKATFATLEQHEWTCDTIAGIDARIGALDTRLSQSISGLESSLKQWVNVQLDAYYTAAQMDAEIGALLAQIQGMGSSANARIDSLAAELTATKSSVDTAKANIRSEYRNAIASAIETSEGKLTQALKDSISTVNSKISALDVRVARLEYDFNVLTGRVKELSDSIKTIDGQVKAIEQSIADLDEIRNNVRHVIDTTRLIGADMDNLKAADIALGQRIDELKIFVGDTLSLYAKTEWVNATFATLEQHQWTCDTIAGIDARIGALDTRLSQSISGLESSLKQWVNVQLDAYYTAAQMDAEIGVLLAQIQGMGNSANARIDSLAVELTATKSSVDTAKANIRSEYRNAIASAIETSEGKLTQALKDSITAVNGKITALTGRIDALETAVSTLQADVAALKAMIQTVSIIPAYNDGSLKAEGGILTINCVITPKEAVDGLTKANFTVLTSEVLTKAGLYGTIAIANDEDLVLDKENGTATIKVDVSAVLPAEEGKALAVALNVKNGISDFTTDFVPVYVVAPPLPEGALAGEFSVSATKKVHFSQGNLYYDGSAFKFEDTQYAFQSSWSASHVSYFFWSKDASVACAESYSDAGASNSDVFFTNATGITSKNGFTVNVGGREQTGWRTLSWDEWAYLFNTTSRMDNSKPCYSIAINGVSIEGATYKGVFIYPDNYSGDVVSGSMTWDKINAAGIVFLPAASYRSGSNSNATGVGSLVLSWSSAAYDGSKAYTMYFNYSGFQLDNRDFNRNYGLSVRLITDVK